MSIIRKYLIPKPMSSTFEKKRTSHIHYLRSRSQGSPSICFVHDTFYDSQGHFERYEYRMHTVNSEPLLGKEYNGECTVWIPYGMWLSLRALVEKPSIEVRTIWYPMDTDPEATIHIITTDEVRVHGDDPDEQLTCRTIATVIFDNAEVISVFQELHPEAKDITNDPAYELDTIWYNQAFPESN